MVPETDWFDTLGTIVAIVLFVPVVFVLLSIVFFVSWILAYNLIGPTASFLVACLLTLGPLAVSIVNGTAGDWPTRLRMAVYLLAIAGVGLVAIVVTFAIVVILATFAVGDAAARIALAVSLVLATGTVVGSTLAIQDAGAGTDWGLNLRMAVACLLLAVLLICFGAGVWVTSWLTVAIVLVFSSVPVVVPGGFGPSVATIVTATLLAIFVVRELDQVRTIERHAGGEPITEAEYPELHALVTGVAAQLDVPVPTIAIADRAAPEALVVGFHPRRTHLILSTGIIDALDRDELEAVVAHELAHVANRDAIVMTAVSLPVILASGLRARISGSDRSYAPTATNSPDGNSATSERGIGIVGVLVLFVAVPVHVAGRLIVAVLARSRETAADRAAVALIGSPAAFVSALRTIDQRIGDLPERDLRSVAGISSLSILPLDPAVAHPDTVTDEPLLWTVRRPIRWLRWRLFTTHPATERRIERVSEFNGDGDDR